jgi:hypothetical protein
VIGPPFPQILHLGHPVEATPRTKKAARRRHRAWVGASAPASLCVVLY